MNGIPSHGVTWPPIGMPNHQQLQFSWCAASYYPYPVYAGAPASSFPQQNTNVNRNQRKPNRKRYAHNRANKLSYTDRVKFLESQVNVLIKYKEDAAKAAKENRINLAKAEIDARVESVTKAEQRLQIDKLQLKRERASFDAERAKFFDERASFERAKKELDEKRAKWQADNTKPWYRRTIF